LPRSRGGVAAAYEQRCLWREGVYSRTVGRPAAPRGVHVLAVPRRAGGDPTITVHFPAGPEKSRERAAARRTIHHRWRERLAGRIPRRRSTGRFESLSTRHRRRIRGRGRRGLIPTVPPAAKAKLPPPPPTAATVKPPPPPSSAVKAKPPPPPPPPKATRRQQQPPPARSGEATQTKAARSASVPPSEN